MFSEGSDRLVNQALAEFMPAANERATTSGLATFHDRLSAFQDGDVQSGAGTYYDDYFAWANPEDYDASGAVVSRHDA